MSYTDEQYRQLGTQISAEQWKSRDWHKENLSIVSSLARLDFSKWVVLQVREHKWSLGACCGYAKLHHLFEPSEMVCSRTLYNMVWNGQLSIHPTELPEALKRKTKKRRVRENKKRYGPSISERPEIASLRLEEGHWEGDTVVGKHAGKE